MRVDNFGILIPQAREVDNNTHVLPHGTQYQIRLMSHDTGRRSDVDVSVDGKSIGLFRLEPGGNIVLEGSPDDPLHGKFTFLSADSPDAFDAGIETVDKRDRGVVTCVFKPERKRVYKPRSMYQHRDEKTCGGILRSRGAGGFGITGLSGRTDQRFVDAPTIEYDTNAEVTIQLRLVTEVPSGTKQIRPMVGRDFSSTITASAV